MSKRGQNEGSIFEERPGRWIGLVTLGYEVGDDGRRRRKRKKFVGETRKAVMRKVTDALRELQTGGIVPIQRDSLGALLERFPMQLRAAGRAASTVSSYEWLSKTYIIPALGRVPLTQLRQTHLNDFMEKLLERVSARTVAYCHAVIRSALSRALKDGLVQRNVAKHATPPAQRRGASSVEPLSLDDARRFLAAVKRTRFEALYSTAIALGLREGEALGLTWAAIDLDAGTLAVTQTVQRIRGAGLVVEPTAKTQRSLRTLELPNFAAEALIAHRIRQAEERALAGDRWREHGLVFPSTIGTPMEPRNLLRHFHGKLKKLGIDRRRFHDLRHTAASLMLAHGASLHEVATILGHTTTRLTEDLYGHIYKAAKREIAARMDNALAPKPAENPVAPQVASSPVSKRLM